MMHHHTDHQDWRIICPACWPVAALEAEGKPIKADEPTYPTYPTDRYDHPALNQAWAERLGLGE